MNIITRNLLFYKEFNRLKDLYPLASIDAVIYHTKKNLGIE